MSEEALIDRARADALARDDRRPRRWWLLAVAAPFVIVAVAYLLTFAQVVRTGGSHDAGPSDAIVVMGAAQYDGRPSPQLASRLDHAAALWNDAVAPMIVVTGGKRVGDRFTEAEASADYLVASGVPESAIVQVGEGSTTYESVHAAAPVMRDLGIRTVAVVTDPYHALRSRLILDDAGFATDVAATPDSVVTGWSERKRQIVEAGGVLIGRVVGFDRVSGRGG